MGSSEDEEFIDARIAGGEFQLFPELNRQSRRRRLSGGGTARKFHNSMDSLQDFEFKRGWREDDVAPADEIFYKGQLLPLQPQMLVHHRRLLDANDDETSACLDLDLPEAEAEAEAEEEEEEEEEEEDDLLPMGRARVSQSCRLDSFIVERLIMTSSRCSSFRNRGPANTWDSNSSSGYGESSSSSRDSNGSSQDSDTYMYSEKEESHRPTKRLLFHSSLNIKSLFSGVRRAAKPWVDDVKTEKNKSSNPTRFKAQTTASTKDENPPKPISNTTSNKQLRDKNKSMAWYSRQRWRKYVLKLRPSSSSHRCNRNPTQVRGEIYTMATVDVRNRNTTGYASSRNSVYVKAPPEFYDGHSKYLATKSCPASMRTSPNHSGVISVNSEKGSGMHELQSAIQGAIAYCKQSQTSSNYSALAS